MTRIPLRGEIWIANLNPTAGKEQQGMRPVLVVSPQAFNRLGLAVICPITQGGQLARFAGFSVTLMGSGSQTQGVVLCNQPRTVDLLTRQAEFVEVLDEDVQAEVLARLQAIFD